MRNLFDESVQILDEKLKGMLSKLIFFRFTLWMSGTEHIFLILNGSNWTMLFPKTGSLLPKCCNH